MDTATPEFIRWSLGYECLPRMACRGDEPEQVERQLKALRAYGDSLAGRRELDGICFEPELDAPPGPDHPPRGFRAAEVLQAYGVSAPETLPCKDCVAHVDRGAGASAWAGCFGWVDWSPVADTLPRVVPAILDQVASRELVQSEFLPTNPLWPGLWMDSPLKPSQLPIVRALLQQFVALDETWRAVFQRLLWGVQAAQESQLPLYVSYVPAGLLSGRHWIVGPHCSRCKSSRSSASRSCPTCGLAARPVPARKRLGRGNRPYWPLADFLAPRTRRDLLRRYLGSRNWTEPQIDAYLHTHAAEQVANDSTNGQTREA